MRQWRSALAILRRAWRPLFAFELLFKLLALVAVTPLVSLAFAGILRAAGNSYLTLETLGPFLKSPLTVLLLAVLALALAVYVVFDIGAILYALELGRAGVRADLPSMVSAAGRTARRMLHPRNWPLALLALTLLPFLQIGVVSGFVCTVAVPEAVSAYLLAHRPALLGALAAAALLVAGLLRWLYVFPFFALEGLSFREARRRSVQLGRRGHLRDLATLLGLQLLFALLFLAAVALLVVLVVFLSRRLAERAVLQAVLTSAVWMALAVLFLVFSVLTVPLSFCCITVRYDRRRTQRGDPPSLPAPPPRALSRTAFHRVEAALVAAALLCGGWYLYRVSRGETNFNIEYVRTMEVTAHRGASAQYPENTMQAFAAAVELGADWIELDVQQTRDGALVVLHDANLRRTMGVDKNIWEVTAGEVAALEAGGWFSETFRGEPAPRLEEVLAFAQEENIRLNIELKPTGHEVDMEAQVAALLQEYDCADRCVVTSQSYEVLQRVKACDPTLKTAYVMGLAYGNLLQLDAADAFSVKAVNITPAMVSRLHNAQKEIYAWTVNSRGSLDRMIRLNVDNVITDNVPLARARIYAGKTSNLIQEYIEFLVNF